MIRVVLEEKQFDFNLRDLQKKLESMHYYGTITLVFKDGKIELIREERTLKPGQFDVFI